MAPKKDLDTFFDPDLYLPIRGKQYQVPAPDADESERLREQVMVEGVPPVEQVHEAIRALGSAFDEMRADGVPWPMILHSGRTAILHFGLSPDMADIYWGLTHLARLVDLDRIMDLLAAKNKKKKL
jgi:hypothetical protein